MKRSRLDAKDYAREHVKGIFGAAPVPYRPDGTIDEEGFRSNLRCWRDALHINGLWVAGMQSEQWGISTRQRKRIFEIATEESHGKMISVCASMDDVIEDALELARHADDIGADTFALSGPRFMPNILGEPPEDTLFEYFEYICERIDVPVIVLNQAAMQGYDMSPRLIARLADIPNVVALKNVPGHGNPGHYLETCRLCGDKIVVSDPDESRFLENHTVNRQQALIATPTPLLLQTRDWQPIHDYTRLADEGKLDEARKVNAELEKPRQAFAAASTALGRLKNRALMKYWLELLGEVGGNVVFPTQELTDDNRETVRAHFEASGLRSKTAQAATV